MYLNFNVKDHKTVRINTQSVMHIFVLFSNKINKYLNFKQYETIEKSMSSNSGIIFLAM